MNSRCDTDCDQWVEQQKQLLQNLIRIEAQTRSKWVKHWASTLFTGSKRQLMVASQAAT